MRALFEPVKQCSLFRVANDRVEAQVCSQKRTESTPGIPLDGSQCLVVRTALLPATLATTAASCRTPAKPSLPARANALRCVSVGATGVALSDQPQGPATIDKLPRSDTHAIQKRRDSVGFKLTSLGHIYIGLNLCWSHRVRMPLKVLLMWFWTLELF